MRKAEVLFGADLRVAIGATRPHGADRLLELVRRVGAQQRSQVVAADSEEAGVELSVRRDPRARAVAAEGLGHRGDDADLARAVEVAVALGDLAAVRGLDRLERELGADRGDDLGGRYDVVHPPAVRRADVHELDEANGVAGSAEAAGDVEDRRLVETSLHDDVDLDRESRFGGRVDPAEHARNGEVDVVHRAEHLVVERVEADGDARESCVGERLRLLCQRARRSS